MNAKRTKRPTKHHLSMMDLAIEHWRLLGRKEADAELARQYEADAQELTAFRDAVAAGEIETAQRLADAMDTIVRDQIPLKLFYTIFPER